VVLRRLAGQEAGACGRDVSGEERSEAERESVEFRAHVLRGLERISRPRVMPTATLLTLPSKPMQIAIGQETRKKGRREGVTRERELRGTALF
jgi:hypothetical protein